MTMPPEPHANGRHQQIFISFADEDRAMVDHMVGTLESDGTRCFVAYRDITAGDSWPGAIEHAIVESCLILVVVSRASVVSPYVLSEVAIAYSERIKFLPIHVDDAALSPDLKFFLINAHRLHVAGLPLGEMLEVLRRAIRKRLA
jgi:hypothetical protein